MNTLFTMTLTGSAMTLCYLFGRTALKQSLSYNRRYLWLNLSVLAYVVPLHIVKYLYNEILSLFPIWYPQMVQRSQRDQLIFTDAHNNMALSTGVRHEILIMSVWFGVALLVLAYRLALHLRGRKKLIERHRRNNTDCWTVDPDTASRYGIRRKVTVYSGDPESRSYSIGILHPVIFLGDLKTGNTREAVLHHELVHIKRYDTVWQMLDILVSCIHWYNPLMYFMVRERSKICEMSNDEIVTAKMPADERKLYAMTVSFQASIGGSQLAFAQNLSKNGYQLKERLDNILSENATRNSTLSAICMAVAIFASSLTVFAYEDIERINATSSFVIDENSEIVFVPEGEESIFGPPKIIYDQQFTDGDGNIYRASYQDDGVCSHVFVPGTAQTHTPDGDGCTVYSRFAQWCNLCSYTEATGEEYTSVFPSCIHDF